MVVKMVKTVCVEEAAQKGIERLAASGTSVIGLVIGQCGRDQLVPSADVVYVVHVVRTPFESGGDDEKTNTFDNDTVVQHAKQVTRMLLGGFDVLGVFVCTPTEKLSTDLLAGCRQATSAIRTMQVDSAVPSWCFASMTAERLFLHISCSPRKFLWKTLDGTSTLTSAKVVEHKVTSTRWTRLQCRLAINETIHLPHEQSGFNLAEQIRVGLDPLRLAIEDSISVVEGHTKDASEKLEPEGGRRDRKTNRPGPAILNVDLLMNTNSPNVVPQSPKTRQCNVAMHMRGTVQGRTHVPSNATVGDAIKCLKLDVMRSLIGRCEIHCEDLLVIDEEQLDRVLVHELPCRIFATLWAGESGAGGITVSDFLFPGEQASDSSDAFAELLDISPSADDIEVACERPSGKRSTQCPGRIRPCRVDGHTIFVRLDDAHRTCESSDRTPSPVIEQQDTGVPVQEMLPPKPPHSCGYIIAGLSVGAALVATAVSFYLLQR